jgi:hypothetical protein
MLFGSLFTAILMIASCAGCPVPGQALTIESRSADSISRYDVLELSFKHDGFYDNKFFDVTVEVDRSGRSLDLYVRDDRERRLP